MVIGPRYVKIRNKVRLGLWLRVRSRHRHTPRGWICVTGRNFATPAALAEVCALLSAILVITEIRKMAIRCREANKVKTNPNRHVGRCRYVQSSIDDHKPSQSCDQLRSADRERPNCGGWSGCWPDLKAVRRDGAATVGRARLRTHARTHARRTDCGACVTMTSQLTGGDRLLSIDAAHGTAR